MAKPAAAKARPESRWPEPLDKKLWPKIDRKRLWKVADVKPYPYNARVHPPAEVTLLATMVRKYGPDQDMVVDEDGVLLKGHGRRLACVEGEIDEFPVTQRFGLSDVDKRAMRIADNQVALMAGWDNDLVRFEIEALKRADYPVELLGFGDAQLVQFTTVPGPPAGGFPSFGEDISTEHQCPACRYRWSGSSAPPPPAEPKAAAKKKK